MKGGNTYYNIQRLTDGAYTDTHEAQVRNRNVHCVDPDFGKRVLVRLHVLSVKSVQEVVLQTWSAGGCDHVKGSSDFPFLVLFFTLVGDLKGKSTVLLQEPSINI